MGTHFTSSQPVLPSESPTPLQLLAGERKGRSIFYISLTVCFFVPCSAHSRKLFEVPRMVPALCVWKWAGGGAGLWGLGVRLCSGPWTGTDPALPGLALACLSLPSPPLPPLAFLCLAFSSLAFPSSLSRLADILLVCHDPALACSLHQPCFALA